jgi:pyridoxamine 5'-phosphate oxidase
MSSDPFDLFRVWFDQARASEPADHDAAAVASVSADGRPAVRMVLIRGYDPRGFVFYTNLDSRKTHEMTANPYAAMCFYWKMTDRQIRIEGAVSIIDDVEADAYFASRPYESQIGAWASKQSQILDQRRTLEDRVAKYEQRFSVGQVPRPDFWSGFRLVPDNFEFWDRRPARLHDRTLYTRDGDGWTHVKLYP